MFGDTIDIDFTVTGADGVPHNLGERLSEGHVLAIGFFLGLLVLSLASIRYTLWGVISTLAIVEQPDYVTPVRVEKATDNGHPDAPIQDEADAEVTLVKRRPITRSIRATRKHMSERAGRGWRWRGLSVFLVYAVCHSVLSLVLAIPLAFVSFGSRVMVNSLSSIIASVLLCRISTTWVHIVISEPSPKPWFRRVPAASTWKHLALPVAAVDAITRVALLMPVLCAVLLDLDPNTRVNGENIVVVMLKGAVCAALGLIAIVSLIIPAVVVLIRIQASLLPEDVETIVPFDRSFGGRVVPQILGGTGAIGFVDAWATFDMASRARLIKLYIKFIGIEIAWVVMFGLLAGVIGAAVYFIGQI